MTSFLVILAALGQFSVTAPLATAQAQPRLWAAGADRAPGLLVNYTVGYHPGAGLDPSRPTVVIIHGINPLHPLMHMEMAQRYSEAIASRWGSTMNVLGWNWNGHTLRGLRASENDELAEMHGLSLAEVLLRQGAAPEWLHLVGHSSGCVVASAAARAIADRTGRPVDRLTLLDPVGRQHALIFGKLQAGSAARRVDHIWATGPTGFGSPAPYPNVRDEVFTGPAQWSGFLAPGRLDHMQLVRWHIAQLGANPWN